MWRFVPPVQKQDKLSDNRSQTAARASVKPLRANRRTELCSSIRAKLTQGVRCCELKRRCAALTADGKADRKWALSQIMFRCCKSGNFIFRFFGANCHAVQAKIQVLRL